MATAIKRISDDKIVIECSPEIAAALAICIGCATGEGAIKGIYETELDELESQLCELTRQLKK